MRSMSKCLSICFCALLFLGVSPTDSLGKDMPAVGVPFWGGLSSGMDKKEVKALYPKYKSQMSDDCPVRVLSKYRKKKLLSLILLGTDKQSDCSAIVLASLIEEYGSDYSANNEVQQTGVTAIGISMTGVMERVDYTWQFEKHRMVYSVMPTTPVTYNLIYTVRQDDKLY